MSKSLLRGRLKAPALVSLRVDLEFKGNEHDVVAFTKSDQPFVIRQTKLDMFGLAWATPAEYLQRWRLSNAAFPDASASFIGYTENARGNGVILTSQPYFEGSKQPQKAIDAAMAELGFEKIPGDQTSYLNPDTKVEIHDAKPDNIIFDKAGNMHPFDVWINDPSDYFGLRDDTTQSLFSAPQITPDIIEAALAPLTPMHRQVFQASQATPTPTPDALARRFSLSETAVQNILGSGLQIQSARRPTRRIAMQCKPTRNAIAPTRATRTLIEHSRTKWPDPFCGFGKGREAAVTGLLLPVWLAHPPSRACQPRGAKCSGPWLRHPPARSCWFRDFHRVPQRHAGDRATPRI